MTQNDIERDELTQYLQETLSDDDLSPELERRTRDRLSQFRSKLNTHPHVRRPLLDMRRWQLALACLGLLFAFTVSHLDNQRQLRLTEITGVQSESGCRIASQTNIFQMNKQLNELLALVPSDDTTPNSKQGDDSL